MAYITAEKNRIVYWKELQRARELDHAERKLADLGYVNIHMWAVPPSVKNIHFLNIYFHCDSIKSLNINLED